MRIGMPGRYPQQPVLIGMVERGELGVKSGRGFYEWDDEAVSALRQRVGDGLATIDRLSGGG